MRSFQTIGVEDPLPGSGTLQVTFVPSHFTGYSPIEVLPLAFGPRQFDQSPSLPLDETTTQRRPAVRINLELRLLQYFKQVNGSMLPLFWPNSASASRMEYGFCPQH